MRDESEAEATLLLLPLQARAERSTYPDNCSSGRSRRNGNGSIDLVALIELRRRIETDAMVCYALLCSGLVWSGLVCSGAPPTLKLYGMISSRNESDLEIDGRTTGESANKSYLP
mmetsp:Transcript_19516/g.54456  ORF Transcript_19516/g.54456 Transcript_19516/m.54456 type:complete len:115 (+) Transcript_19516:2371-2715(+)